MVMLKPVSPYISDAVAHIFYYTQHMATVHYENGKLHVHQEIVNNAKKNGPAKESPASKKENSATDHISLQQKQALQAIAVNKTYPITASANLLINYLAGEYPPPRA
jgi:hypothetical protein